MCKLILVDSMHPIPDDYSVQFASCKGILLEEHAARCCEQMLLFARKNDNVKIKPLSGYRSIEYQEWLWNRDISGYLSKGLDVKEAEKLTSRYLAKPRHSEHHTGLAIDFCSPDWDDTQDDFQLTKEGKWLKKNAHLFGFILRYPRMKEHITGISYEPWHYRYVGLEHAKIIFKQSLTLEEYLYYYFF